MDFMLAFRARRQAARDARNAIENNLDATITALAGTRPDVHGEREDAALVEQEGRLAELEGLGDELESIDRDRTDLWPLPVYLVLLVIVFAFEVGASSYVYSTLGFGGAERLLFAFGTAIGMAFLAGWPSSTRGRFPALSRAVGWVVFATVVSAIAWLRAGGADEELPMDVVAASAVVMLIATGAMAWATHHLMATLTRANELRARRATVTGMRRTIERGRSRARDERIKRERAGAEYDALVVTLRAFYNAEHRRVTAELRAKQNRTP